MLEHRYQLGPECAHLVFLGRRSQLCAAHELLRRRLWRAAGENPHVQRDVHFTEEDETDRQMVNVNTLTTEYEQMNEFLSSQQKKLENFGLVAAAGFFCYYVITLLLQCYKPSRHWSC